MWISCNAASPTVIYTLSLHDALPISPGRRRRRLPALLQRPPPRRAARRTRSEEHTSELQSRENLVCRLLLEKKNAKLALFNASLGVQNANGRESVYLPRLLTFLRIIS